MPHLVRCCIGALLAAALATAVRADEAYSSSGAWLHLNGYTRHFDAPGANSNLLGLGATWHARRLGRVATAWEADAFSDSARRLSAYAGESWRFPFRFGSVGITAALMYHRNFARENRWCLLPVGLPFIETPGDRWKLRVYYVPPIRSPHDEQIAVQLLARAW